MIAFFREYTDNLIFSNHTEERLGRRLQSHCKVRVLDVPVIMKFE